MPASGRYQWYPAKTSSAPCPDCTTLIDWLTRSLSRSKATTSWLTIGSAIAPIAGASEAGRSSAATRMAGGAGQLVGADPDAVVVGAEVVGDHVGVGELVALLTADRLEADREGRQPGLALLREHAHDQAGVQAPGEQHADRDVGDQTPPDGRPQRVLDRVLP